MTIEPLYDNVVIKRSNAPTQTKAGLFIPDSARETLGKGFVVAVGKGKIKDDGGYVPLSVQVGDEVLFDSFVKDVKINDELFIILEEKKIIAVLRRASTNVSEQIIE